MSDITRLLGAFDHGDPKQAAAELLPLVYEELRKLAAWRMAREKPGHTLQATALVHEAWLQLAGDDQKCWDNRGHFFAAAAEAMRRILVANARRKSAVRHGGGQQRTEMEDIDIAVAATEDQLLEVHEALDRFAERDPLKAELVKLRYFVGMTIEEAAQALNLSVPTANRYWAYARAWLTREIRAAR